jgi:aspartyl-tRNA(Asn)/glutamyl-tRNA(Gln) amidotransferase subunit C
MQVGEDLIQQVAENARLQLTAKEITAFKEQFKDILSAFSQLDTVEVKGIQPEPHPLPIQPHVREDTPKACLKQEEALSTTKHSKEGFFKGPKIM